MGQAKAVPPPIRLNADLDGWLDQARDWSVPLPERFEVRGAQLVAVGEWTRSVAPTANPWLPSDLAYAAQDLDVEAALDAPPLRAQERLEEFATEYGLPVPWSRGEPPQVADVRDVLESAWRIRELLRELSEIDSKPEEGGRLDAFLESAATPTGVPHLESLEPLWRPETDPPTVGDILRRGRAQYAFGRTPSLLEVIELQLLADIAAGHPVRSCEACRRLFIWPRGRRGEAPLRRGVGLRGPRPKFCSYEHSRRRKKEVQ